MNCVGDYRNRQISTAEANRVLPGLIFVFLNYDGSSGLLVGAFHSRDEAVAFKKRCQNNGLSVDII